LRERLWILPTPPSLQPTKRASQPTVTQTIPTRPSPSTPSLTPISPYSPADRDIPKEIESKRKEDKEKFRPYVQASVAIEFDQLWENFMGSRDEVGGEGEWPLTDEHKIAMRCEREACFVQS
jgi:hypothetical protein